MPRARAAAAALTLRTEPGAEQPGVPGAAGKSWRPHGCSRRQARGVRRLLQRERGNALGSGGGKPSSGHRGAWRPSRRERARRLREAGSGRELRARKGVVGEPTSGLSRPRCGRRGSREKNERERDRERETGRARQTRREEAAGGAGAPRARGGEGTAAAQPGSCGRCRTQEGARPAQQLCAASAGRARVASAGLLKRAPGSPPPTRTSTAGSLELSERPATRPTVSSPSRRAPPAPSPGSPFLPFSGRAGVSAHRLPGCGGNPS